MLTQSKKIYGWLFCLQLFSCACLHAESHDCQSAPVADFVAFSFDRPMQLFALLESVDFYIDGLGDIIVIYRASNDQFKEAYEQVIETFPDVIFLEQGNNPHSDFKPLTLQAVFDSPHDYVLFAVDDIIVKDFIDIKKSVEQLEKYGAYAVYFKMGLHLTKCYPIDPVGYNQPVPPHKQREDELYSWRFCDGTIHRGNPDDWRYPHTVDMTMYRKKDLKWHFYRLKYRAPNSLEGAWACYGKHVLHKAGLFYAISKAVNLPLNKVQKENHNRSMNAFSPQKLLEMFNQGMRIDIHTLYQMKNEAVHSEYIPSFVHQDVLQKNCLDDESFNLGNEC
jgi:hypothetical protein